MQIEQDLISKFWIPFLFILLSIPLILKKIKPNRVYGVRLKATLSDESIWYRANRYFGWHIFIVGTLLVCYRLIEAKYGILQNNFMGAVSILVIISIFSLFIYLYKIKE